MIALVQVYFAEYSGSIKINDQIVYSRYTVSIASIAWLAALTSTHQCVFLNLLSFILLRLYERHQKKKKTEIELTQEDVLNEETGSINISAGTA